MIRDYLQDALKLLMPETPNWYGWAKIDSNGNKIPNDQRMQTQHVVVNSTYSGTVTRPTDQEINSKVAELKNAEPMRVLREERNRKLAETDWWCASDRTPTQAQLDYRKSLRDLPSTAKPKLDENGNLTGVTWPNKPE